MNDELHKKILSDLDQSGFGSEMRSIRAFLAKDWGCRGGYYYFDEDTKQNRETDLQAWHVKSKRFEGHTLLTEFGIIAEVKKTERPWVVFKREHTHGLEELDAWNNLTCAVHLPCNLFELVDVLSQHSLLQTLGWRGYSIHESFKKPDAPSRWYSAFVSVCKATEAEFVRHSKGRPDLAIWHEFSIFKPVVIVDGPLMAASLNDAGEVNLEEIDFAPFEFVHKSTMSTTDAYRVDLVKLDSLPKYVDLSEQRLDAITSTLESFMPTVLSQTDTKP